MVLVAVRNQDVISFDVLPVDVRCQWIGCNERIKQEIFASEFH
jgi:hypothetical protein